MSVNFMNPLKGRYNSNKLTYDANVFTFDNLDDTLAANKLFPKNKIQIFDKISRYGYFPIYQTEQVCKEYLFFTKPDLNIFGDESSNNYDYNVDLNKKLKLIPFFIEADERNKAALRQLQYSVQGSDDVINPFMYLLSNTVTSRLDLPAISADSKESTSNIMGTSIQYRSHSYKSDNGYDFSLSFTDTAYLDLYTLLKAYDEYMRLIKTGEIAPMKKYIVSRIISEQFSIYKFLIGEDGETILFYSKLTGCYFTDVPRSDVSDPGNDGFKYSVSFHAQFVEDSNPMIINEFNRITPAGKLDNINFVDTYNFNINAVDNSWVKWPIIITANKDTDLRVKRRGTDHDYRLRWV